MERTNWQSFEEYESLGMPIKSTTSVEAVKLYDAAVSQYAAWSDYPQLGGLGNTLLKMNETDPEFVLGRALTIGLELMGFTKSYYHDESIRDAIKQLEQLTAKRQFPTEITTRERKHVEAVRQMTMMKWSEAAAIWDDEIVRQECPLDFHALKMAFYVYLMTGQKQKMLEIMYFVYPHFKVDDNQKRSTIPNAEFIDGYMAFVLEESGHYVEAEKYARKGLKQNPGDGWATHALAHILEMKYRHQEGAQFMQETVKLWPSKSTHLACHNFWHQALFNIGIDRMDRAIELYDQEIIPRVQSSQTAFSVVDASALLCRLSMIDPKQRPPSANNDNLTKKFADVFSVTRQFLNRHVQPFTDAHFVLSCLGSGNRREAQEMADTINESEYFRLNPESGHTLSELTKSLLHYHDGDYAKAVDRLEPVRGRIVEFGGSDAQRDIFNQLLMISAMKSNRQSDQKLFAELQLEREKFLEGTENSEDPFIRHLR